MMEITNNIKAIRQTVPDGVTMVCVSKFQPIEYLAEAYHAGERDFGESRVKEMCEKYEALPKDIRWHFIGHLQTNKVRLIAPFVHLIQSVDSVHLIQLINCEAARAHRVVNILLEVHTANEPSKSGFRPEEIADVMPLLPQFKFVKVCGLMTMATSSEDKDEIHRCFRLLKQLADDNGLSDGILSFGMSGDYEMAIEDGANMIRIGTKIFGER